VARLFIAVWPSEEVIAALSSLPRKDQDGIRFVPVENWHITLRFLGEAEPNEVVKAFGDTTVATARAHLGPSVELMAERALVVPVQGLDALADAVTKLTGQIGKTQRRRFVGHLTLARAKPKATMPPALGMRVSAAFDVNEVALVHSELGPSGSRYETIKAWPLTPARPRPPVA
jgi:2'-5' RNA ligase